LNTFDSGIITFFNQFSRQSVVIDNMIVFVGMENLFKGGVIVSLFWWFWFKPSEKQDENRSIILANFLAAFSALFLGKLLQVTLPFRLRPLHHPELQIKLPYGMNEALLKSWSSIPSDHAILFFALATGFFFLSHRLGVFAFIYVMLIINLPRIYLGVHYPTDITSGAAIGIFTASIFNRYKIRKFLDRRFGTLEKSHPGVFYTGMFIFSYLIATLFVDIRRLFTFAWVIIEFVF
jgi:membrane-associated phospholipid phosphatase